MIKKWYLFPYDTLDGKTYYPKYTDNLIFSWSSIEITARINCLMKVKAEQLVIEQLNNLADVRSLDKEEVVQIFSDTFNLSLSYDELNGMVGEGG